MTKKTRVLTIIASGILLAGCTSVNTNSDEQGIHYSAGDWSDTTFGECINPGTQEYFGPGDLNYVYPAGNRTFTFDDPGDRPVIDIADKDGQPLTVAGILTFTLSSDCDVLRDFHENIGLKYGASGDGVDDWNELLNDYLGQPLRAAMRDAAGTFGWRDLYSDPAAQDAFTEAVKEALPNYVEDLAGNEFFTNFTLLMQAPQPGQQLLQQIEEQNTQAERETTIAAQARAQALEIEQIRQLVELLGQDGYIAYRNQLECEANSDSCVPFIPIPQGSGIIVQPGG